jgi:hypothetical protein
MICLKVHTGALQMARHHPEHFDRLSPTNQWTIRMFKSVARAVPPFLGEQAAG